MRADARAGEGARLLAAFATRVVPRLARARAHKGSHGGKIAVVGGSELYAGAPYFASAAAMRAGCDLCHVFTHAKCAPVMKGYGPDLIVHEAWSRDAREATRGAKTETETENERSIDLVEAFGRFRIDNAVIGPGLGRGAALEAVEALREVAAACVVDADGLKALEPTSADEDGAKAARGRNPTALATPNKMELWRLVRKASGAFEGGVTTMDLSAREDREKIASALRRYAGYNFLVKGEDDYLFIQHWDVAPSVCDSERAASGDASIVRLRFDGVGSPKRSGGQGDILAGVLAVFLLWSQRTDAETATDRLDDYVAAVGAACFLVKAASSAAYREYGRGAHAQDVLARVASTFMAHLEPDLS